jgi:hypothetical protein
VEALRVVRLRGSHILYTIGLQMAVRFSAMAALYPQEEMGLFLGVKGDTHWLRGWEGHRASLDSMEM